ncbi:MAG: biopolymer transporter ExbD [Gammaproteobacteria bacterium]|nr:biopolymer transporter ExbD [Gammaproteobacteria bacterium]MCY4277343.1 biopolymer transporter ExbD [Gammaproteobacteria bacterium]MCY4323581.1 biopolymer transporter ExbD [Gammaproteobacteria bacterium]
MARQRFNRDEESDINLAPMLDVVFIMLIFFIVTATFIKQAGIDVLRPAADSAEEKPTVSVLVAVSETGDIWIDNKRVDPAAVRANIERIHAENPKGGLVVQADRGAQMKQVMAVLAAARAANITQVALSTER